MTTSALGDRWWRGVDDQIVELLPPGARVLDVGCGNGGLVDRLAARGLDSTGVDPTAPDRPRLVAAKVEELPGVDEYHAACAVMSLHHAELEPVCAAVDRLLKPSGLFLVSEFSWDDYDERARGWADRHDHSNRDNTVAAWVREHEELHTAAAIRTALAHAFEVEAVERVPYLARMLGRRELELEEAALIERGSLPALGRNYTCRARDRAAPSYPDVAVSSCGAPTGFDSGEPRCRR